MSLHKNSLLAAGILMVAAACSVNQNSSTADAEAESRRPDLASLGPDEVVLATVNGSPIGRLDVDVYRARTVGADVAALSDPGVDATILDSLIASRAIAQRELSELSADDIALIEKRVAQFREELLVKRYLLDHAKPNAISNAQIKAYYDDNPDLFAGVEERRYEFLTVSPDDYNKAAEASMDVISRAKTHDDWQALAQSNTDTRFEVRHNVLSFQGTGGNSAIEKVVAQLSVGNKTRIVFQEGAPYIARLLDVSKTPAKSLEQARAEIRKRLLPASIKRSVKSISKEVVADAQVQRF